MTSLLLATLLFCAAAADDDMPKTSEDILKKYKAMLPSEDEVEKPPLPDHKPDTGLGPIWQNQWVCVPNPVRPPIACAVFRHDNDSLNVRASAGVHGKQAQGSGGVHVRL